MTYEEVEAMAKEILELLEMKKISIKDARWVLMKAERQEGTNMEKQLDYSELVNLIEKEGHIKHKFDVVAYLIGYQGVVTATDFKNILKLYGDGFID